MRTFRFIRLWLIPLLSLTATFYVPVNTPLLWLLWMISFVGVCDGGSSAASMLRPAFWVGLHVLPIVLQLL